MKEYIIPIPKPINELRFVMYDKIPERYTELIRCKDCKHYHADPWGYGNCGYTEGFRRTHEKGYCSWAERKEE